MGYFIFLIVRLFGMQVNKKISILLILSFIAFSFQVQSTSARAAASHQARYLILLIGDGMGANHMAAANLYTGETPNYQSWFSYWMTTYSSGGSYDPALAWTNFSYPISGSITDSAAAATAIYTGQKTANGRINASVDGSSRLTTLAESAMQAGLATGAVSSVPISDATPGTWIAHNQSRTNGFAIADESLWGDPLATGTSDLPYYGGSLGSTPPLQVLIGGGHPNWYLNNHFVNSAIRDKLAAEDGEPGAFSFVERINGSSDGGSRLLAKANESSVVRLAGLFGSSNGNLDYRLADGSGANPENPTLVQIAQAALKVLSRDPDGFVLMIEGGAIDKTSHQNNMDQMIGEMIDFNNTVQAVVDWVDDPGNGADWSNTLVIVTADHETGYLTAAPGAFPNQPLGDVNPYSLALEKPISGSSLRASWEDGNANNLIDSSESVYWAWNTGGHTNSLVRVFARGIGSQWLSAYLSGNDPVRGQFIDNTAVYKVMKQTLAGYYDVSIPLVIH